MLKMTLILDNQHWLIWKHSLKNHGGVGRITLKLLRFPNRKNKSFVVHSSMHWLDVCKRKNLEVNMRIWFISWYLLIILINGLIWSNLLFSDCHRWNLMRRHGHVWYHCEGCVRIINLWWMRIVSHWSL